jgi:hypothetical protein
MDWIPRSKKIPDRLDAYEVTLQDINGARFVNVAIFRPENATWEILTDRHAYADCKVIAWKQISEPYQGRD